MLLGHTADNEKPCLIESGQGFSVLYKKKYLYSRRNPQAAAKQIVSKAPKAAHTLFLCYSPLLSYGLTELLDTIPENTFVLCIEADIQLADLFLMHLNNRIADDPRVFYLAPQDLCSFTQLIEGQKRTDSLGKKFPHSHLLRRAIPLQMSAGVQFSQDIYASLTQTADSVIAEFWKNRLTLMRLGRRFSANLFRNMGRAAHSAPFPYKTEHRPIVVAGAGPSADCLICKLKTIRDRGSYCLISVDAAAKPLISQGLIPDAIVAMESQSATAEAYAGITGMHIPLFADLTSLPEILDIQEGPVYFFLSQYVRSRFMQTVQKIIADAFPILPPLGSVGIVAVYISMLLRAENTIPIFIGGLDFSYGIGLTHCRGSVSHIRQLAHASRISPAEDIAAYRKKTLRLRSKDGSETISEPALAGYAAAMRAACSGKPLLFDVSPRGLDTGLFRCSPAGMAAYINQQERSAAGQAIQMESTAAESIKRKTDRFYFTEKKALRLIRRLLESGEDMNRLRRLLSQREYLYLHFPDGCQLSMDISFLKRIRAEADSFLKDMEIGTSLQNQGDNG